MLDSNNLDNYNDEPVFYCKHCLSLRIRSVACLSDSEYCDECGSTYIELTHIDNWSNMYKLKYGHNFLDKNF